MGVAPVAEVGLAGPSDVSGARLRGAALAATDVRWFEIACRGGHREPTDTTTSSRGQISRALMRLKLPPLPQEFIATERIVFFIRATRAQLEALIGMVDCIYEFDIAAPDVRDWLLVEEQPVAQIRRVQIVAPPQNAPAVAILDTGISQGHPLLSPIVANSLSVLPGNTSATDDHGHGTNMAGLAAYEDVGAVVQSGRATGTHWLESARVLVRPQTGTAAEENRPYWPKFTENAVRAIEAGTRRRRAFAMAVTADLDHPGLPTYWSHALEQLAYGEGRGRLVLVSAGNADVHSVPFLQAYPTLNLEQKLADPSQAMNAITVGAFTGRVRMPPHRDFAAYRPVAPANGVSPHSRAGLVAEGAIKPDIVFEGGNVAFDGKTPDSTVETLVGLTTGHDHTSQPLALINGTSEATARAGWFAAQLLRTNGDLRVETIRGLIVHSASWTDVMRQQLPNLDERIALCGYGVPDLDLATSCLTDRATVIVEDEMPNAMARRVAKKKEATPKRKKRRKSAGENAAEDDTEEQLFRVAKIFKMPFPQDELLSSPDAEVELRVTLSYFPEPNTFRRQLQRGLDLRWDMQGPVEPEDKFLERINRLARQGPRETESATKSFDWDLGLKRRRRGTVQSDRWRGKAAFLAGAKLLAVYPALGWWDRREDLKRASMRFSLIITVQGPGLELYNPIQTALAVEVET
jgi:hypothetical protein